MFNNTPRNGLCQKQLFDAFLTSRLVHKNKG